MAEFDFIGCGEASNKKDAQSLAARSFCKFLVEQGLMDPSSLPAPLDDGGSQYVQVIMAVYVSSCISWEECFNHQSKTSCIV